MAICKLPPLLLNQIAAGEIIERPASVIKELVENSLDAGATRIQVAVEEGGRQLIRVSDDGHGITKEDLALAVAPHATSKLTSAQELMSIATLGFRGEAMASIASVSRLRVTSRASDEGRSEDAGFMLEAEGESISALRPTGCAPGTIVEVRDLFFNTPARRKFMRTAGTEFGHIAETVTRIAMAWPGVGWTLMHNGRNHIEVSAGESPRQRCLALMGQELAEALIEVESQGPLGTEPNGDKFELWGLAGHPSIARRSAKFQYVCLNGRPVRDRNIAHAVKEAYRGLIPHDHQPVAVAMLSVDPNAVDVNVHPAKAEVRFSEPGRVHGLVLTAFRQCLLGSDLTPTFSFDQGRLNLRSRPPGPNESTDETYRTGPSGVSVPSNSMGDVSRGWSTGSPTIRPQASGLTPNTFVDFFKNMDATQKGFVYREVKRALEVAEEGNAQTQIEERAPISQDSLTPQDGQRSEARMDPKVATQGVLQVHKSYLVTEDEQGLLIVDQHALHERVMFEQLRDRVFGNCLESQRLLVPETFSASAKRVSLLDQLQPLLKRVGIEAEAMGPETIAIHAFSSFLFDHKVGPVRFVEDLLDRAEEGDLNPEAIGVGSKAEEAVLHEVLDMMACKAAIKAGDQMTSEELVELLAKREQIERSSNCPHGRPTTVRVSLRELAKQFKRT